MACGVIGTQTCPPLTSPLTEENAPEFPAALSLGEGSPKAVPPACLLMPSHQLKKDLFMSVIPKGDKEPQTVPEEALDRTVPTRVLPCPLCRR